MKLWLIIPVKPLSEGKSRLTSVLAPAQRRALTHRILQRELDLAQTSALIEGVVVVSRDAALLGDVTLRGALPLFEETHGLNAALETARSEVSRRGADALLVLPADLPFVTATDIEQIVHAAHQDAQIVLAPSPDGGTNALLLKLPSRLRFAFGSHSFARHRRLAQNLGLRQQVVVSPSLAFDLDWPADWEVLRTAYPDFTATPTALSP